MSVTMREYEPSDPTQQAQNISRLMSDKMVCPMCQRVGKWYYRFHDGGRHDNSVRCTMHEITPIPGPRGYSDDEKVTQLY